eukprot:1316314-Rhodomonas_salina.1
MMCACVGEDGTGGSRLLRAEVGSAWLEEAEEGSVEDRMDPGERGRKEGMNLEGWRRVKLAVKSHTESPTEKVFAGSVDAGAEGLEKLGGFRGRE